MTYFDQCTIDDLMYNDKIDTLLYDAGPDAVDIATDNMGDMSGTWAGPYAPVIWMGGKAYVVSMGLWGLITGSGNGKRYQANCAGHGTVEFSVTGYDVAQWQRKLDQIKKDTGVAFNIPGGDGGPTYMFNPGFNDPDLYQVGDKYRPQKGIVGGYAQCYIGFFP